MSYLGQTIVGKIDWIEVFETAESNRELYKVVVRQIHFPSNILFNY